MLEVENGKLTGKVVGAVVNRQRKRDLVESLCQLCLSSEPLLLTPRMGLIRGGQLGRELSVLVPQLV